MSFRREEPMDEDEAYEMYVQRILDDEVEAREEEARRSTAIAERQKELALA